MLRSQPDPNNRTVPRDPTAKSTSAPPGPGAAGDLGARLLAWYDRHGRALPWRAGPGAHPDPYRVWLSEIMLQQTTVATVEPYFRRFTRRWANVDALAAAGLDDVLHAWQGLGYYARARNLHACARIVSAELGGRFPDTEAALRRLPGIGAYTAAAVAAIAFHRPATVVDANVERVIARLYALDSPIPAAKGRIRALAAALTQAARPGDYAQAIMDLGATVCTARAPLCPRCPWAGSCAARALGAADAFPLRAPKRARPLRRAMAFWLVREDGAVWLRRRPESGLLGGMMEVPSTEWREADWTEAEARAAAPSLPLPLSPAAGWRRLPGLVRHSFTHFHLEMAVLAGRVSGPGGGVAATAAAAEMGGPDAAGGAIWVHPDRLGDLALPTVMKKIIRHALAAA